MVSVSAEDVRDVINVTSEEIADDKISKMIQRAKVTLELETDKTVDPATPLIAAVGRSFDEGLTLLSRVGLNDAFLFVMRYSQLSDGQRYRYRLARMIESDKPYWFADEFCSTLDRDTAKIVAFNIQKIAKEEGKSVFAATTHTDLFDDLKPSIHIHKRFGREIEVN